MDMTLKTNGFNFLNEINHNDRGNPHPQYIGVKERIKLPENNKGKVIKFAEFEKTGKYYSSVFEFEIGVLNHNGIVSKIRATFCLNKLTTHNATFYATEQLLMSSEVINAVVLEEESEKIRIGFYITAPSDAEMYFKPINTITYGSYLNNEYNFNVVSVFDNMPSGVGTVCRNTLKVAEELTLYRNLIPNNSETLGTNSKPFENINGKIIRSLNGYIAIGYGSDLTTIRRTGTDTILAVSNGSNLVDSIKFDQYGNVEILNSATGGIKLTSPNGTKYKITINDSGVLTATRL